MNLYLNESVLALPFPLEDFSLVVWPFPLRVVGSQITDSLTALRPWGSNSPPSVSTTLPFPCSFLRFVFLVLSSSSSTEEERWLFFVFPFFVCLSAALPLPLKWVVTSCFSSWATPRLWDGFLPLGVESLDDVSVAVPLDVRRRLADDLVLESPSEIFVALLMSVSTVVWDGSNDLLADLLLCVGLVNGVLCDTPNLVDGSSGGCETEDRLGELERFLFLDPFSLVRVLSISEVCGGSFKTTSFTEQSRDDWLFLALVEQPLLKWGSGLGSSFEDLLSFSLCCLAMSLADLLRGWESVCSLGGLERALGLKTTSIMSGNGWVR